MRKFSNIATILVVLIGIGIISVSLFLLLTIANEANPGSFLYPFDQRMESFRTQLAQQAGHYSRANLASDLALERLEEWSAVRDENLFAAAIFQLEVAKEEWLLLVENDIVQATELRPLLLKKLNQMEQLLTSKAPNSYPVKDSIVGMLIEVEDFRTVVSEVDE